MGKLTVEHVLGFIDGRLCIAALRNDTEPSYKKGLMDAYEDLKAYILIEGNQP